MISLTNNNNSSLSKKEAKLHDNSDIQFIDGMRGLASFYVMVGHARWLLWEGYSSGYQLHPEKYSYLGKMFVYFLSFFKFGHEAVLFFFVLSGFVIHLKYSRKLSVNNKIQFDWSNYFLRRIKRIYPPFLFSIFLTFILDKIGLGLGYSIYFANTPNELINSNVTVNHSVSNFLGNLIFYEDKNIGIWGTNGPLWSLKYEWWFYMLYPLLFLINKRNILLSLCFVIALFVLGVYVNLQNFSFFILVFKSLICWYFGVVLADVYTKRIAINQKYLGLFSLVLPIAIFFSLKSTGGIHVDILWAITFFGILNLAMFYNSYASNKIQLHSLKWLGDCSYTLYVIHFPIFVFLNGIILSSSSNQMPISFLPFFSGIILVLVFSYLIHFLVEKPFISSSKVKMEVS